MMTDFLVMIKPDGVSRELIGEILTRFERKDFVVRRMRLMEPIKELFEKHYSEHINKAFYNNLLEFMLEGPIVAMILCGDIGVARNMIGATNPADALKGTIRGDFCCTMPQNLIHCSSDSASAEREVKLWSQYL